MSLRDAKPKEGYVTFVNLRDEGRIPKGMTWEKWQKLTKEEQRNALVEPKLARFIFNPSGTIMATLGK